MENYTMHLLVASEEMDIHKHSLRWKMGDLQISVTILSSGMMGGENM
jgi:hypothetical protein